ncbi:hypothetical protein JSO19_06205 [Leucobacter sp. UCMA 4100]|uniref:hypothetical protein n=1 Tax=Leucobacter sp. UCMA 4100 TaxID=2810534 RepID=UPI0022EB0CCA|nr:hypothetical protein [Leucobacter sp. UCMA 4100]MDA3146969.1 hypothetical protein [Leucobacter sp. UCMA 4100]
MNRINGRALGLWSLRFDAIYCALLGAAVAVASAQIARTIALPAWLLAVAGIVVVVWAGLVMVMVAKLRLRIALRLVMGVNIVAALLVAACSMTAGSMLAALIVVAIAIDILLFAVSQALALRTLPAPAGV